MRILLVMALLGFVVSCKGGGGKSRTPKLDQVSNPGTQNPILGVKGNSAADLEILNCIKVESIDPENGINGFELVQRFEECGGKDYDQFERVIQDSTIALPEKPVFVLK